MSSELQPKVFDVGHAKPASTSKPVIVGHRPVMPDPMMRPAAPRPTAVSSAGPQPPVGIKQPSQPTPTGPVNPHSHTAKSIPVSQAQAQAILKATRPFDPQLATNPTALPPTVPAGPSPAAAATMPSQPVSTEPALAVALQAELAQPPAEPVPQVINNPTGVHSLPVSHRPASSNLKFSLIWIISIGLVILIAAYLFIDAGIIKSSIKLPFHIFNGQTSG